MSSYPSTAWLLLALWVWPLLLAPLAARARWAWLPTLGALPSLIAALLLPVDTRLELPWLMLGTELGLDNAGRVVLLFSGFLWMIAGVFVATLMRPNLQSGLAGQPPDSFAQRRFNAFFLLAMSGQLWAVVGLDMISFYVGFAIMGLSSYALVVADGSAPAMRAGRLYLMMTVVGEVALFAGLASIAAQSATLTPTPQLLARVNDLSLALVLVGLAVKAAIVPLHLWLPLTYPVAPVAATAVLSSAMINIAVLGWLRWLPLGAVTWPGWALALTIIGLFTALYALLVGLTQIQPKAVLAYSSISKMGFLLLLTGLMLGQPELAGVGVMALLFYAAHHALTKAALFLGLGLLEQHRFSNNRRVQRWLLAGLGFLALALAGAPLTSGALAKYLTQPLLKDLPWVWLDPLLWCMTLFAMALMARFFWLAYRSTVAESPTAETQGMAVANPHPGAFTAPPNAITPALAWSLLLGLVALLPWVLGTAPSWLTNTGTLALALVGCALVLALARRGWNPLAGLVGRVPPGDLLPLALGGARALSAVAVWLWTGWQGGLAALAGRLRSRTTRPHPASGPTLVFNLQDWPVAGALWLSFGTLLLFLLLVGGSP